MRIRNFLTSSVCALLIACVLSPLSARCQEAPTSRQGEDTIEGTVVSSTRETWS